MTDRWDETWHRLREWTNGQAQSERLAAQILVDAGYVGIDPSHPLGGKDGAKDAICQKDGERWIMAAYFPRGQQDFAAIESKFASDHAGVKKNGAVGIAFVTNQELRLAERKVLQTAAAPHALDLFHLERVTLALDKPAMSPVRKQFLGIDGGSTLSVAALQGNLEKMHSHLAGLQTGGNSFCYLMLYHFDLHQKIAQNFVVIRKGDYPLYDVRLRIMNLATRQEVQRQWGEISAPAEYQLVKWPLQPSEYYRVFVHARNGQWHQDLQLKRSEAAKCWLAATRVIGGDGAIMFEHTDGEYEREFGSPAWER